MKITANFALYFPGVPRGPPSQWDPSLRSHSTSHFTWPYTQMACKQNPPQEIYTRLLLSTNGPHAFKRSMPDDWNCFLFMLISIRKCHFNVDCYSTREKRVTKVKGNLLLYALLFIAESITEVKSEVTEQKRIFKFCLNLQETTKKVQNRLTVLGASLLTFCLKLKK